MSTVDIVQKLWSFCDILRDDGISYHQYVTELTLLLFLKMTKETGSEKKIPPEYRWDELTAKDGMKQYTFYRDLINKLGQADDDPQVAAIYAGANTSVKDPKHLSLLVKNIDSLDWQSAKREKDGLGDLYEGLLEKNSNEIKSGAGQYFTIRALIDSIVRLVQPKPGEIMQDPAAGTAGFIIAVDKYIKDQTDELHDLDSKEQIFQKRKAFIGMELVPETRRLSLMNCMLHDIEGMGEGAILLGDTLGSDGLKLPMSDLILTNPPFGTKKGGGLPTRDFTHPTSNKQLVFLQHIYRSLKPGGRAAVVLPDNVLFEDGIGQKVREDLMDKCDLHTILRLPTGIFYAAGVKTNVLFFTRGTTDKGNTKDVWVYDLRTNMPSFGKRTQFTREHLAEFEKAFGKDPLGKSKRKDEGETGRFRKFSRTEIKDVRKDNLDISWLKDENAEHGDDLPEPEILVAEIKELFTSSVNELLELEKELSV
jgi:type I restriction enzyme M protein